MPRRPAGDLIDAIVHNMRTNLEALRYSTVAPSRYTVYVSPAEYSRLEGILPRLRSETIRALNEELARQNRRSLVRRAVGRWLGQPPPLEHADAHWHVDFVPDLDGELRDEQDIIVHSELILPAEVELGSGERTRRLTTVHAAQRTAVRLRTDLNPSGGAVCGRLVYHDQHGAHQYDVVKDSTTIGRGGTMYPVDVRVATTDEVSREHARIRRDPATGALFLIDLSTHGTTVDGRPVPRGFDDADGGKRENGAQMELPSTARIGLANTIYLEFERRG
jgi:hypothetical protein